MLGMEVEASLGRLADAVVREPGSADAHFALGLALLAVGEDAVATECLAAAVRLRPGFFAAYRELGALQAKLGDWEAARAWYLLALGCPEAEEALCAELGGACWELGLAEEARRYFLRALECGALDGAGCLMVGAGLVKLGLAAEAMGALRRAVELGPSADAWTELGACQFRLRNPGGAEVSYGEALRCDPEYAPAHANLGLALLLRGEYGRGFREMEWRLRVGNFYHMAGFDALQWRGEPLRGKTILLHAEQGFGDTLQFVRYVPLVAARGGQVVLVVQAALHSLLAGYPGVAECVPVGRALPALDFHCSLMSLAWVFGTTYGSVPGVDAGALGFGEAKRSGGALRVGIAWAGNAGHLVDGQRSVRLRDFAGAMGRLGRGVRFVSLQHGAAAVQLGEAGLPFAVEDGCSGVKSFAETAAVVAGLDLVIAVDTAVAHLAGSMGKPVWVLLGRVPEWRWGMEGETTPWYRTMRLWRATEAGGWGEVLERVTVALERTAAGVF